MKHFVSIKCPCCDEQIEIDTATGRIEKHYREGSIKKGQKDFLKKSLLALKVEENNRNERFKKLKKEKDERLKTIEERFKMERERVKKSPDDIKPKGPYDLD